jgi:D-3-phosphoglycerate dehydrogenase / 2-oxoglutarate reductase
MIGAREFALMQPHAYFITTARGFIHDERALTEALREKRIAGAGIDVWDKEPPRVDHPLLQFDNVLATPHTAGMTREARANMGRIAAERDDARRQAPAPHCQSAGMAGVRETIRSDLRLSAGRISRAERSSLRNSWNIIPSAGAGIPAISLV